MKKVVSFLVVFVLLFSLASISTAAEPDVLIEESAAVETETQDLPIAEEQAAEAPPEAAETATSDFTYEVHTNGRTASITGYTGSETSITIPSVIDGYKIVEIKKLYTVYTTSITYIHISDGITNISWNAFTYNQDLQGVYLPNTLKSIGESAFARCKLLDNVNIPPSVKSIGYSAFEGCSSLKSISLPSGVSLGDYAFKDCTSLTGINLSNLSTTYLPYSIFEGCTSLRTVHLPKTIETIYDKAFKNCTSLKSLKLPATVTKIDFEAFAACRSLESLALPTNLSYIGESAFEGCHKLQNPTIPKKISYIGSKAFSYCESITEISLPTSLKEIKSKVFENCISLKTAFIANSIKTIESNAFTGCPKTLIIKSPVGSAAEAFAKKQGFRFEPMVDPQKLEAPKNFKAKGYPGRKIRLTWKETPGASGYYIYMASHLNGTYKCKASVGNRTSYTHSRLVPNRNVYYKIVPYVEISGIKYKGATAGPVFARAIK